MFLRLINVIMLESILVSLLFFDLPRDVYGHIFIGWNFKMPPNVTDVTLQFLKYCFIYLRIYRNTQG